MSDNILHFADAAGLERASDEPALMVDVEGFEGPLDLLLMLARQQKVDLAKISILALADQYLAFIEAARRLRLELAADYLVMAAWLAYLKSRLLLPDLNAPEGQSAEEMASALAYRLKRLEAFREVAGKLLALPQLSREIFHRGDPQPIAEIKHPQWSATLYDLLSAYALQRQKRALGNVRMPLRQVWSLAEARSALEKLIGDGGGLDMPRRLSHRLCGRAGAGGEREGVELRRRPGNGARRRSRRASARRVRADLCAQACTAARRRMPARRKVPAATTNKRIKRKTSNRRFAHGDSGREAPDRSRTGTGDASGGIAFARGAAVRLRRAARREDAGAAAAGRRRREGRARPPAGGICRARRQPRARRRQMDVSHRQRSRLADDARSRAAAQIVARRHRDARRSSPITSR